MSLKPLRYCFQNPTHFPFLLLTLCASSFLLFIITWIWVLWIWREDAVVLFGQLVLGVEKLLVVRVVFKNKQTNKQTNKRKNKNKIK